MAYGGAGPGSTATISNGWLMVSGGTRLGATDSLVLNNSTIKRGKAGVNGALTNAGILRASGTISGLGAGPGLVRIESYGNGSNGLFVVGNSLGQLTLHNLNLEVAAGTRTEWEFSEAGLDLVILNGGAASLLGSNVFTLAPGAATPVPGVKYGLGFDDFLVASNITWNPQYEHVTNLLASYGLVQGVDFSFGVVGIGGGLQALRLEFVPEPSTVLLLVGGGLLLFRLRRGFDGQGRARRRA